MINKITNIIRKRFPFIIYAYHQFNDWFQSIKTPKDTPLGFKLIGNSAMMHGEFEPGETKVFIDQLSDCDVVINVGANVGYYCCIALKHSKRVIAFEPMVNNVRALLRNISVNGWGADIEVFPLALSDKVGIVDMFGSGTGASLIKGWANAVETYTNFVPCSTMDLVLGRRFKGQRCLILVDIEGAERGFLSGASFMLDMQPKPIWMVEISVQAHQPKYHKLNPDLLEVFETFWSRGYEAWTTHNDHRKVVRAEVEAIVAGGPDTLWGDTFLFIPNTPNIIEAETAKVN